MLYEVITSCQNLAEVYSLKNEYEKSIELYKKAAEIYKEGYDDKDPNYAINLSNIALVYQKQGNYSDRITSYNVCYTKLLRGP